MQITMDQNMYAHISFSSHTAAFESNAEKKKTKTRRDFYKQTNGRLNRNQLVHINRCSSALSSNCVWYNIESSYWCESKMHTHNSAMNGEIYRRKCWAMLSNWWFRLLLCAWTYLDLVYTVCSCVCIYITAVKHDRFELDGKQFFTWILLRLWISHLIFPFFSPSLWVFFSLTFWFSGNNSSSKKTQHTLLSILSKGVVFYLFVWVRIVESVRHHRVTEFARFLKIVFSPFRWSIRLFITLEKCVLRLISHFFVSLSLVKRVPWNFFCCISHFPSLNSGCMNWSAEKAPP